MTKQQLKVVCLTLCQSGKFETGQGTCAAICMDQLGDARKRPCSHVVEVHEVLASNILINLTNLPEGIS